MFSTIVIGAGLAGRVAAYQRAVAGDRVLLLAKSQGTDAWAPGTIDLLAGAEQPLVAIEGLIAAQPAHPYALAGRAALLAAVAALQQIAADAGYPLVGSPDHTLVLPTALGALRPTTLAPATMAAGERRLLRDGRPTLIVGLRGMRDFFPDLIAAALREQQIAAEAVTVELSADQQFSAANTVHLARAFERPSVRQHVARQLAAVLRGGRFARVAFPAVLGLEFATAVVRDLQDRLALPVFEIPTLPTSVPGLRLSLLLERALQRLGVRIQLGSAVVAHEADGERLRAVFSDAAARRQQHRAEHFILATGGFAGGGLRGFADGRIVETALDLPLQAPDGRGAWFARRFLDPDGHPLFRSGVRVNPRFRPLDTAGRPVFTNLTVAGSLIAGCDPLREGCREGTALATGWAAAAALTAA